MYLKELKKLTNQQDELIKTILKDDGERRTKDDPNIKRFREIAQRIKKLKQEAPISTRIKKKKKLLRKYNERYREVCGVLVARYYRKFINL